MNRNGVIAFYLLTYTFGWGLGALFAAFPVWMVAHFGPVSLWNPIVFVTIWTPTIWAFILAYTMDGAAGLRDLLVRLSRWRVGLRWYLISTVGIATLAIAARFVDAYVTHAPLLALPDIGSWPALIWYGVSMLVVDPGPIGEDPGWRGYALPRMLQRFSPATGSILLGVVWAVWHLPAFYFSGMPQATLPLGWFLLTIVALTVLMSWVAINTRGAVIPAILMHWTFNRAVGLSNAHVAMCSAIAFTLAVVIVLVVSRGRMGLKHEAGNIAELQT